jgi:uncharacterized membrane protein YgcG
MDHRTLFMVILFVVAVAVVAISLRSLSKAQTRTRRASNDTSGDEALLTGTLGGSSGNDAPGHHYGHDGGSASHSGFDGGGFDGGGGGHSH